MKTGNKLLLGTLTITSILLLVKAVKLVIPVLLTGSTAFIILVIKAYIGRKAAQKIDEFKDKVTNKKW